MTDSLAQSLVDAAAEALWPGPPVHVLLLAQIGVETYELGAADLTPDGHHREFAELLRAVADQLEAEP